jgi:hypothetical protein
VRRRLLRGTGAAAVAVVGAAPVVLPLLAWVSASSRGVGLVSAELDRWNLPLPRLVELVVPHVFRDAPGALTSPLYIAFGGGQLSPIPWLLSVYAGASMAALAVVGAVRARPARWLLAGAAVLTWMALGRSLGFGQLLPYLPLLRGFRYWEKLLVWPSLLLPLAATYGFDAIVEAGPRWAHRGALAAGAVGLACAAALRLAPTVAVALLRPGPGEEEAAGRLVANLAEGTLHAGLACALLGLVLVAIGNGLLRRAPATVLALVWVGDLFAANVRGYVLAEPATVQQPGSIIGAFLAAQPGKPRIFTPYDMNPAPWPALREFEGHWRWGSHVLQAAFNVPWRVGNFMPYTGMVPDRIERFNRRAPIARQLPHIGIWGIGYMAVPGEPARAREAGLLPPYEVAAAAPELPAVLVRLPHRDRAYIASELAPVDRRGAMEFVLGVDPARSERTVVEGPVPDGYVPAHGTARIAVDDPERVVVETAADRPALLVLNDMYAPGWTARVDGRPADILPADYLARGVWIPAGAARVEFAYRTPLLREGWAVALLGALALAVCAIRSAWGRRRAGGAA